MPGAAAFQRGGGEGAERACQRIRAEERSGLASSRTSHSRTPFRSAARLRRREAVKESARGLPAISPITQARSRQRTPSSSAKSASSGVTAATWISRWRQSGGSPARQGRPPSWIALRSCTHSTWRVSSAAPPSSDDVKASRANASASPAPLAWLAEANISEWNGCAVRPGRQRVSDSHPASDGASERARTRAGEGLKDVDGISGRLICSLYVPTLVRWQWKGRGKRSSAPRAPRSALAVAQVSRR